MKKVLLSTLLLLLFANGIFAQSNFFEPVPSGQLPQARGAEKNITKKGYFRLNEQGIHSYLSKAPLEFKNNGKSIPLVIPYPNGKTEIFNMVESPILSAEQAALHPEIKTYSGKGSSDKNASIRLSLTSNGFNAIILFGNGDAVYFEKSKGGSGTYFNYFTKDVGDVKINGNRLPGGVGGSDFIDLNEHKLTNALKPAGANTILSTGSTLTLFRIVMSATGEFVAQHGGTQASAYNDAVGYVNRLNIVYRNELSVGFTLVGGQNLMFLNAATDPYDNADEGQIIRTNTRTIDSAIGSANYDIAHVLGYYPNTTGGGLAYIPALGNNNIKGGGTTAEGGTDVVAQSLNNKTFFHETGHMFGMTHSFNSIIPVCISRTPATSVEPGAGITIMSYSQICDGGALIGDNYFVPEYPEGRALLQFHTVNYQQAVALMASLTYPQGVVVTSTSNNAPVITMPATYTIPKSTPFALTGIVTDETPAALTYCWEGTNTGGDEAHPPDANTLANTAEAPFSRTYAPATSPTRIFPILDSILNGSNNARADKLPSVTVAANYNLTVRDNSGGVNYGSVTVNVNGAIGPFLETTNLSGTYLAGSSQTITWSVNGTDAATPNVKISLSTDGGQTFPITLAASTNNDGSEVVTIPNNVTTTARIKVEAAGNIFFDISNANFAISNNAFYVRTDATDLALPASWTTDINGETVAPPANFTTANQVFIINRKPILASAWTISGGSNVVLATTDLSFNVGSSLTVGTGSNFDFGGNNSYSTTFQSSNTGTAFLGKLDGTISNATNVTVERYITAAGSPATGSRAYRSLAPSVTTTTSINANWQEGVNNTSTTVNVPAANPAYGTHITGSTTGANGLDATISGAPSLFTYNGTGYSPVLNTNTGTTLNAKTGYLFFVRGDRNNISRLDGTTGPTASSNTTLRATGTLLTGDQSYTLNGNSQFTLITNPYASPINWATLYDDASTNNLASSYTYVDPRINTQGGYVTVTSDGFSTPSTGATVNIQSGQAFFVKATSATVPTITIKETHKSTTNNLNVFRTGSQEQLSIGLYFDLNGTNRVADGVNVLFNNNYSADVDGNDAEQITNFDEDISINRGGKFLAIEGRPLADQFDTISLNMIRMKVRDYHFEFLPAGFNAPGLQAYLQDKFLGTETSISLTEQTNVNFSVSNTTGSAAADRFRIVFKNITVLPINFTLVKAFEKGNAIQVEWNLGNESSLKQYEVEKSTDGRTFTKVSTQTKRAQLSTESYNWLDAAPVTGDNYYRIKAIEQNGEYKYSQVVNVKVGKGKSAITIYPNPVKVNSLSLQFINKAQGQYNIQLINNLGQVLFSRDYKHAGGSASQTLQLNNNTPKGIYQLRVSFGKVVASQKVVLE